MKRLMFTGVAAAALTTSALVLPSTSAWGALLDCSDPLVLTTNNTTQTLGLKQDCQITSTWTIQDGWTLDGNGHTLTADATGGFSGPIISSTAGTGGAAPKTLGVAHLTIQTLNFNNATGRSVGILYDGAVGRVNDVRVNGVSQNGNGYAIEADNSVGATLATTDQVKIDNGSSVSRYGQAGVYAHGDVKFTVLRANIGAPATNSSGAAGVLATAGSHGSVKENTIRLSDVDPATTSSFGAGVRLSETRRVEIKRNVFTGTNADFGISVSNPAQAAKTTAAVDCNLFKRNDTSASDVYGVAVGRWAEGKLTNVVLSNSTFQGNWNRGSGDVTGTSVTAGVPNTHTGNCPPGAPTNVNAGGGNGRTTVAWKASSATPAWAPVTGYDVTAKATGRPAIHKHVKSNVRSVTLTGLSNKVNYKVTVTARSNGGSASTSDTLFTSHLTLSAKPSHISSGQKSVLRGTLSTKDPSVRMSRKPVVISAKTGGRWHKVATVRTNTRGVYSLGVKPGKKTQYRAAYNGKPCLASSALTTVFVS